MPSPFLQSVFAFPFPEGLDSRRYNAVFRICQDSKSQKPCNSCLPFLTPFERLLSVCEKYEWQTCRGQSQSTCAQVFQQRRELCRSRRKNRQQNLLRWKML